MSYNWDCMREKVKNLNSLSYKEYLKKAREIAADDIANGNWPEHKRKEAIQSALRWLQQQSL